MFLRKMKEVCEKKGEFHFLFPFFFPRLGDGAGVLMVLWWWCCVVLLLFSCALWYAALSCVDSMLRGSADVVLRCSTVVRPCCVRGEEVGCAMGGRYVARRRQSPC